MVCSSVGPLKGDLGMNDEMDIRNCHYVPQFVLRWWRNAHGLIWTRDRYDIASRKAGTDNLASEKGFFTRDYEDFVSSEVEKPASEAFARLIKGGLDALKPARLGFEGDRFYIARFMLHQWMRTELMREAFMAMRFISGADEVLMRLEESRHLADRFMDIDQVSCMPGGVIYLNARAPFFFHDFSNQGEFVCTDNPVLNLGYTVGMPIGRNYWLSIGSGGISGTIKSLNRMVCAQSTIVYGSDRLITDEYAPWLPDDILYDDKGVQMKKRHIEPNVGTWENTHRIGQIILPTKRLLDASDIALLRRRLW